MITGQEVTNLNLTANAMETIDYSERQRYADIINYGPGDVYMSWRKEAAIGDRNCLLLKAGQGYELRTSLAWEQLKLISAAAAEVQVVVF